MVTTSSVELEAPYTLRAVKRILYVPAAVGVPARVREPVLLLNTTLPGATLSQFGRFAAEIEKPESNAWSPAFVAITSKENGVPTLPFASAKLKTTGGKPLMLPAALRAASNAEGDF